MSFPIYPALALTALLGYMPGPSHAQQTCSAPLEASLGAAIKKQFPGWHNPDIAGLADAAQSEAPQHAPRPCTTLALADFDGDGREDAALLLWPKGGGSARLIVAAWHRDVWQLRVLPAFCDTPDDCYVDVEPAGIYRRTPAAEDPLRHRERRALRSAHASIRTGQQGATGIVWTHGRHGWRYVWVSD